MDGFGRADGQEHIRLRFSDMDREKGVMAAENERQPARLHGDESGYHNNAPFEGYAGLIVLFSIVAGGFLYSKKRLLPERIRGSDTLLLGVATQKVSRLLTKA